MCEVRQTPYILYHLCVVICDLIDLVQCVICKYEGCGQVIAFERYTILLISRQLFHLKSSWKFFDKGNSGHTL